MENGNKAVEVTDRRSSFADIPADEPILSDMAAPGELQSSVEAPPLANSLVTIRPKRTIIPWGERILVKPDPPEQFYDEAATIKKADVNQEKALEGTVVWMGLEFDQRYRAAEGTQFLQIGDKVGYVKFTGTEFNEDDEELLMLRPDEVLCVILVAGGV